MSVVCVCVVCVYVWLRLCVYVCVFFFFFCLVGFGGSTVVSNGTMYSTMAFGTPFLFNVQHFYPFDTVS